MAFPFIVPSTVQLIAPSRSREPTKGRIGLSKQYIGMTAHRMCYDYYRIVA